MTSDLVRWGVIGPGGIAASFASSLRRAGGGTIVAVSSRSAERAAAFADTWDIPNRHLDDGSLVERDDLDAVYVATPHSRHAADAIAALGAGKHVLCEKPIALDAEQAGRMVDVARTNSRFLMDAIWSRFLPAYRTLVEVLASGRIGEPRIVEADFGFRRAVDPTHRLFDLSQGGGALLDLGIYPIQLCSLVLGTPSSVTATATLGSTGVDEQVAALLEHPGGAVGIVKAALRVDLACRARISGTEGAIELPAPHHCPASLTVVTSTGLDRIDAPFDGDGLRFEIDEVHRCLRDGRLESDVMPLDETLTLMSTLDEIRSQIGLDYPDAAGP